MVRWFLGSVLLAVLAVPSFTFQARQAPDFEGQPTQLRAGALQSYWMWHDYDGYHLRTTTAHDRHVFTGRIEFSGGEAWVKAFQLRQDDFVRLVGRRIEFHLATQQNLNGFDFRIDNPNEATIFLEIDGHKVGLDHVFVGQQGAHPSSDPFTVTP